MSKMTTIQERERKKSPFELEFVEFLEFIGRLAQTKFMGSEVEDHLTPTQKIEYILEDLFAMAGLQFNEVVIEETEESGEESEEY